MLAPVVELQASDLLFIVGIVCTRVGALAQDRMRRGLRGLEDARESRARGFRLVRAYHRAAGRYELAMWPVPVCCGGFAIGFGSLAGALLMLFVA
jgi:hypothetical protein